MQIKTLSLAPYAGVHRLEVDFHPGLNVLVGPNEAGKSTVVEALYDVLFQPIKLKRSVRADNLFQQRARRFPDGDHAHLQLIFQVNRTTYTLTKHWQQGKSYIGLFDGKHTLVEEETILRRMESFLKYGSQTYANVLFARQRTFRETLEQLQADLETASTVDQILKKAVMQLDGVPVETLRNRIGELISQLGKRWDVERDEPENSRTVQNPYKAGVGEVLKAYYEKEALIQDLQQAQRGEQEQESIEKRLEERRQQLNRIAGELGRFESIEQDVIDRDTIVLKKEQLLKEYQQVTEVNRRWPVCEAEISRLAESIDGLSGKVKALKEEWDRTQKAEQLKQDQGLLERVEELERETGRVAGSLEGFEHITESDFIQLEEHTAVINRTQAAMEAATLLATLEKAPEPVTAIAGFGEPQVMKAGQQLTANGSLRLETGEGSRQLAIRISAGQIDYATLRDTFQKAARNQQMLLKKMNVRTMEEAGRQWAHIQEKRRELGSLQQTLQALLKGKDLARIRKTMEDLEKQSLRTLQEVGDEQETATASLNEQLRQQSLLQQQIRQWKDAYGNHDKLLENLVEMKSRMHGYEKALSKLAELPEGFASAGDFRSHLRQLRDQRRKWEEEIYQLKYQLTELQHSLPQDSVEELDKALEEARQVFEHRLTRLKRLTVIRDTLEKVLERLDQHSTRPLEQSFSHYLGKITENRYKTVEMKESLQVTIKGEKENASLIPPFFSAGTYDTVALAFRFALADQLFQDDSGLLVLDDCLVNLDPDRKASTIALIREQASRHQLIFTTCHPDTAEALGGHRITLTTGSL